VHAPPFQYAELPNEQAFTNGSFLTVECRIKRLPIVIIQVQARQAFEEIDTPDGFIRWRTVLPDAGGTLLDGAPSCLVLVALHQMVHRLVWCWWLFIKWRTVFSGADGASSDGAPSCLILVAPYQMAHRLV
jgi:hypothetical protein